MLLNFFDNKPSNPNFVVEDNLGFYWVNYGIYGGGSVVAVLGTSNYVTKIPKLTCFSVDKPYPAPNQPTVTIGSDAYAYVTWKPNSVYPMTYILEMDDGKGGNWTTLYHITLALARGY